MKNIERARRVILLPGNAQLPKREALEPAGDQKGAIASTQTPGDTLSRLNSELYDAMHVTEISDVHEKCKKYLQILRRYLFFEQNESGAPGHSAPEKIDDEQGEENPFLESKIVETLPTVYRAKALKLLKNLTKSDRFSWVDTGEVKIDRKTLQNSNILDLLFYLDKKPRGDVAPPTGRLELLKLMRESETPKNLVGNTEF